MSSNRRKAGILQLNQKRIFIYNGVNQIGRNKDAVVVLKDTSASQHHAQFVIVNGCHYLTDLKSTNGTLLNRTRLLNFQLYELHDGDEVQFTPNYKGTYKKIPNLPPPAEVTQTNNQSQLSQTQNEHFYAAATQLDGTLYLQMLEDGEDENFARINTQVVNRSLNTSRFIHDLPTQVMPYENVANTQVMATQDFFNGITRETPIRTSSIVQSIPVITISEPEPVPVETTLQQENSLTNEQNDPDIQSSPENIETLAPTQLSQLAPPRNRNKSRIIESDTESDEEERGKILKNVADIEEATAKSDDAEQNMNTNENTNASEHELQEQLIEFQSDDSTDYFKMASPSASNVETTMQVKTTAPDPTISLIKSKNNSEIDVAVSDTDVEDGDDSPLNIRRSKSKIHIIHDSSDEELMDSSRGNKENISSSTSQRKFVISSSEDEESNDAKDIVIEKSVQNVHDTKIDEDDDDDSDEEESLLGWGKTKCDISLDEIPATQNIAVFKNISSISSSNQVEPLAGNAALDQSVTSNLISSNTPTEEPVLRQSESESLSDKQESCDFFAATQPLLKQSSRFEENQENDIFGATQKNCEDIDFMAPTQMISAEICDFLGPTHLVGTAKGLRTDVSTDGIDFTAETQELPENIMNDVRPEAVVEEIDFISSTQPLSLLLNNNSTPSPKTFERKDECTEIEEEAAPTPKVVVTLTEEQKTMTQQLEIETNKQPDTFQQVESQLQDLFASQTTPSDATYRPANPVAIAFDALSTQDFVQSTQDVLQTLNSESRKRNSEQFEGETSDNSQKRIKLDDDKTNAKSAENKDIQPKKCILSLNKRDIHVETSDDECNAIEVLLPQSEKPKRRFILDDDTLSQVEYATPPKAASQERARNTSTTMNHLSSFLNVATKSKPRPTSSSSNDSEAESTRSYKNPPPRRSSRLKPVVSYNERVHNTKITKAKERPQEENDDLIDLEIRVPKTQNFIISLLDDDSSEEKKDISTIVRECLKPIRRKTTRASKKLPQNDKVSDRGNHCIKPKIVFTMLDDPALKLIIRSLGGFLVETIDASTVLVTKSVQRTLKLLVAMAQNKPICSPTWLHACKKAGKFLDPWDYIIEDMEAEAKWGFSMKESLRHTKRRKLFADLVFQVIVTQSADTLKGAIEAHGGQLIKRKPMRCDNLIVVAANQQNARYSAYLKDNIRVVSSEAILISILRQKIHFEEYLLD